MKGGRELALLGVIIAMTFFLSFVSAAPTGPSGVTLLNNLTKAASAAYQLNVSGGYIAYINISATVQDVRWKAFVGNISGKFTLADSTGSSIYDWSLASITGRVYSTRNSSAVSWATVQCANKTVLEFENVQMNQTSAYDNITATFNSTTHTAFFVGNVSISANSCPSLATNRNSAPQTTNFQEVTLTDSTSVSSKVIYSTNLEQHVTGFDNKQYDFQMIVPENGAPGYSGITPYYLYVELS
jgi:hypothetical protein